MAPPLSFLGSAFWPLLTRQKLACKTGVFTPACRFDARLFLLPNSFHYHATTKPKSNPTEDGLVNDNEGSFSPPPHSRVHHLPCCWCFFYFYFSPSSSIYDFPSHSLVFSGVLKRLKFHRLAGTQMAAWTGGRRRNITRRFVE